MLYSILSTFHNAMSFPSVDLQSFFPVSLISHLSILLYTLNSFKLPYTYLACFPISVHPSSHCCLYFPSTVLYYYISLYFRALTTRNLSKADDRCHLKTSHIAVYKHLGTEVLQAWETVSFSYRFRKVQCKAS